MRPKFPYAFEDWVISVMLLIVLVFVVGAFSLAVVNDYGTTVPPPARECAIP